MSDAQRFLEKRRTMIAITTIANATNPSGVNVASTGVTESLPLSRAGGRVCSGCSYGDSYPHELASTPDLSLTKSGTPFVAGCSDDAGGRVDPPAPGLFAGRLNDS
jgi:hypothetical protein